MYTPTLQQGYNTLERGNLLLRNDGSDEARLSSLNFKRIICISDPDLTSLKIFFLFFFEIAYYYTFSFSPFLLIPATRRNKMKNYYTVDNYIDTDIQ